MSISRKEIRDAAANARAGQIVYIDGERLTADQLGDTGKYVYTYMDHPGFTAVSALVEFIQAKAKAESFAYNYRDGQGGYVEGDAPTGGHTDGAGALAEDAAGCHYDDHPSIWGQSDALTVATNHAPLDTALSNKRAERRIRSHRRKLRRSGVAKGISVLG